VQSKADIVEAINFPNEHDESEDWTVWTWITAIILKKLDAASKKLVVKAKRMTLIKQKNYRSNLKV
jgi:hypothetical protein